MTLQNNHWIFGEGVTLDFSTPVPTASTTTTLNTLEGCSSISDASGNLLMYTDGITVWDGTHTVRASGLQGHSSSTQSAIIVPNPGNAHQYYVFTSNGSSGSNHHFNGRRFDVTNWGNQVQLSSILPSLSDPAFTAGKSPTEKVIAIQHANCRDYWVLTVYQHAAKIASEGLAGFRLFLVHASGVHHVADVDLKVKANDVGYLKASPDGTKLAMANWVNHTLMIFSFNPTNGAIDTNAVTLIPPSTSTSIHPLSVYGVEFSPDSRLLYYTVSGATSTGPDADGFVFQHDLSGNGPSVKLGTHKNAGGRYALGALQLGPDKRIYIAQDSERFLGIIRQPNLVGAACQLQFSAIKLGKKSFLGLPNLIANYCDCACDSCEVYVEKANNLLEARARTRKFTVFNNGVQQPQTCGPAFRPRNLNLDFTFHWGDGPKDRLETHDTEVVYVCIRNPFSNLCFKGVTITQIKITPNFTLPDAEAALRLVPEQVVCFDEIGPCASVCRDFTLILRNAKPQSYKISFEYCIEEVCVLMEKTGKATFTVNVDQS